MATDFDEAVVELGEGGKFNDLDAATAVGATGPDGPTGATGSGAAAEDITVDQSGFGTPGVATDLQGVLEELEARITAVE
jgi:hypothetical protein